MTVRIREVRRTLICYGKMFQKDERTLTNKQYLPCHLEMLALLPERKGDPWNNLSGKTRGHVALPTSPMSVVGVGWSPASLSPGSRSPRCPLARYWVRDRCAQPEHSRRGIASPNHGD